ncbi:MAG: hypothetical protein OXC93_08350 [Rhodospirillaceae bacterium]|nr:hypothetical protein [Rhodospirillaceae bacterium]
MGLRTAMRCVWQGGRRIVLAVLAVCLADAAAAIDYQFSGRTSMETRWFPRSASFEDQRNYNAGFAVEPQLFLEDEENFSVTIAPFFRYDAIDRRYTHVDVREAYLLLNGSLGENEWELRLGIDRVFWGVAEVHNLVNIINQTDLVEDPDEKTKLGQLMAHSTLSGTWGVAELFVVSFHRLRTFPGPAGRLRPALRIDNDLATYESGAKEWHLDFAARYSHSLGPLDLGLSVFDGTNRQPAMKFVPVSPTEPVLAPHYEQILQFGLDAQLTIESWLLKLEAIHRSGASNLANKKESYAAFVVGGEYTFTGIFESDADLSLLSEWIVDGRRHRANNQYQNDLFLGASLSLNDVQGASFTLGMVVDLDYGTRTLSLEFERRLTDALSVEANAVLMLHVDRDDTVVYATRRDSFVSLGLIYSF